jgi:hypothetical protein
MCVLRSPHLHAEIPDSHRRSGSQLTPRRRKADSNHRSRSYEWVCLVSPHRNDQLAPRVKLRSSRETAMAAGALSAGAPFTAGPTVRIRFDVAGQELT